MKLRSKKSEYQQCYSSPDKDYFKTIYEEQLAYRMKRREKEHCHYVMRWDSENSEESSNGEKSPLETSGVASQGIEQLEDSKSSNDEERSVATYIKAAESKESNTAISHENKAETKPSCAKQHKIKTPSIEHCKEKPPFLSYGWADERIESGRKKTHNIRAPKTTVYPSALQRLSYLKQEKIKQRQKSERRAASASIPLYQKPTDTSCWQSEYQRCYSSQSNRPSSAPTQRKRDSKPRKGFRSALKPSR